MVEYDIKYIAFHTYDESDIIHTNVGMEYIVTFLTNKNRDEI